MSDQNRIVTRSAPAWAWDIIDETLQMDSQSKAFDPHLRQSIHLGLTAMIVASERADDEPISREDLE